MRARRGTRGTLAEVLPPRPCWADLADSSQEASQDRTLAPLLENSYDAPALGVENSKDGLNGRLAESMHLKSAPKDFSFLLNNIVEKVDNDAPNAASEVARVADDSSNSSAYRPFSSSAQNAFAQFSLAELLPQDPGHAGSTPNSSAVEEPAPSEQASAGSKRSKRGKRALSQIQAPAMKRTRDESASSTDTRATVPIPEASEEEWHHRIAKRDRAIATIKSSKDYILFTEARPNQDDRQEGEPQTPQSQDRTTSKRRWEYEVQQWRAALRQWCQEHASEQL